MSSPRSASSATLEVIGHLARPREEALQGGRRGFRTTAVVRLSPRASISGRSAPCSLANSATVASPQIASGAAFA